METCPATGRQPTVLLVSAAIVCVVATVLWGLLASCRAAQSRLGGPQVVATAARSRAGHEAASPAEAEPGAGRSPVRATQPGGLASLIGHLVHEETTWSVPPWIYDEPAWVTPQLFEAMREGLKSRNPQARENAAQMLRVMAQSGRGPCADPRAARETFEPLLADPDIAVRTHAALALSAEGTEAVCRLLRDAVDPSAPVEELLRMQAVYALGRLGAREAIPDLCRLIEQGRGHSRRAAADMLGNFRAREALAVLEGALDDADPWLVTAAMSALGDIGDPRALPAVRRAARHNPSPLGQTVAQWAIARLSAADARSRA